MHGFVLCCQSNYEGYVGPADVNNAPSSTQPKVCSRLFLATKVKTEKTALMKTVSVYVSLEEACGNRAWSEWYFCATPVGISMSLPCLVVLHEVNVVQCEIVEIREWYDGRRRNAVCSIWIQGMETWERSDSVPAKSANRSTFFSTWHRFLYSLSRERTLVADGIHHEHLDMGGSSSGLAGNSRVVMKSWRRSTSCLKRFWDSLRNDTLSWSNTHSAVF